MAITVSTQPKTSDLLFPETAGNLSRTLLSLKKSRLSIRNRLTSILTDADFARSVAKANRLPLIANERCGSWYIPTEKKKGSVYFKSTDGHQSQWRFSTRRLNLELLEIAGKWGGCIVVDSTRRGKTMPDALSKTIPIWCAVMNYFLFPEEWESHKLVVSDRHVSASEASEISKRLDDWRLELAYLGLAYEPLATKAKRPLRPYFVSPASGTPKLDLDSAYTPVVCCSVSRREQGDNDAYVQGAGDDNENWSRGLTADLFWAHRRELSPDDADLRLDDTELAARIDRIVGSGTVAAAMEARRPSIVHRINSGSDIEPLYICDLATLKSLPAMKAEFGDAHRPYDLLVTCDIDVPGDGGGGGSGGGSGNAEKEQRTTTITTGVAPSPPLPSFKHLARFTVHLKCRSGKLGSRALRKELGRMVASMLNLVGVEETCVLFACATGRDLAVGMALAASVLFYSHVRDHSVIDKTFIRNRLAMITVQYPQANPSRATLQSVNAFLMQEGNGLPGR